MAEKYCKKIKSRRAILGSTDSLDTVDSGVETIAIDMYTTSCQRESVDTFHQNGQDKAVAELASLYEVVQKMPDGPQKTHFLKKVRRPSYWGLRVLAFNPGVVSLHPLIEIPY